MALLTPSKRAINFLKVFLIFVSITLTRGSDVEHRLYEKLMGGYDILERPVPNSSWPVTVYLGLSLQQLIDMTWNDYKMVWNSSQFGISDVRFPSMERLWKPDVLLYNSVDSSFDSTYPTNLVVYSDGTISWIPPGIFKISCKINIEWFPFDEQNCFFKFGSWTYDGTKLDLQPDAGGFDMSEYLVNGEWNLYNTTVVRSEKFYDCCPEPYPDLRFIMHMRRRTLYYAFNLIIPCILITMMTLLGFTLPPDAEITVLLSICFFLSIVSNITPPTSEAVPLLGVFFSTCMFVVAASVVTTVAVLNLHHRTPDTHHMGKASRAVLLYWLPFLLRMSRPGRKVPSWGDLPKPWKSLRDWRPAHSVSGSPDCTSEEAAAAAKIAACVRALAASQKGMPVSEQALLVMLHRIFCELHLVTMRMGDEDDNGEKENEWKFAAMCVDRLCLWMFTGFILLSSAYIFNSAPYLTA